MSPCPPPNPVPIMSQRCQHSGPRGQCSRPVVDGSKFCLSHCKESERMRGYVLSDEGLRQRFDDMSAMDSIETVRQEVRLLRALIEDRVNLARNEAERITAFQVIHPAISTLNKLVESLRKLEIQTNEVLGKGAISKLGDEIVTILIEELCHLEGYTDIIDRVAARIADSLAAARNED